MNATDRVLAALAAAWMWLAVGIHPIAPWVAVALLPFGINLAIRTWWPCLWQAVADVGPTSRVASKAWQAIPSVITGAIIVSLGTGADLQLIAVGSLVALVAPVGHELLRWATAAIGGPRYLGGRWPAAGSGKP